MTEDERVSMDTAFRAEIQIKNSKFYRMFKAVATPVMWTGDQPLYQITESDLLWLMSALTEHFEWLSVERKE